MSNSLDNLSSYYLPNTLDGINIISDEVSSNALLVDGTNFMLADLNMNIHNIKNLDAGIDANDAVNVTQLNGVSSASKIYSDNVSSSSSLYTNTMTNLVSSMSYLLSMGVSSSSALYAGSVSSSSFIYANSVSSSSKLYTDSVGNNVSSASFLFATTQSALKVNKAGDTMSGALSINYTNALLEIRATDENQDAMLYLTTPYQNGAGRRKTAVIADGISTWNRANLHFCLNQAATHDNVTISDSKMCIINSTGNVGIATTTPTQKLDVSGNTILRGSLDMNTTNKIINVANGTSNTDVVNLSQLLGVSSSSKLYTDTVGNNVSGASFIYANSVSSSSKLYTDSIDTNIRTDVNSALNLKVNRSGDTMTGNLIVNGNVGINTTPSYNLHVTGTTYLQGPLTSTGTVSGDGGVFSGLLVSDSLIVNTTALVEDLTVNNNLTVGGVITANAPITLNGGTANDTGVDTNNEINTYVKFGPAGATSDWAYLRQIGASNMMDMALDFHDDYDGGFSIRNVQSSTNPDTIRTLFRVSRTRGFYCPSGMYIRNTGISTVGIDLNNETGKYIVWVYGSSQLNSVILPDTTYVEIGATIYVYNCTSQTLDVKTYNNLNKIYKNSGNSNITTLLQPQGAIFMYDGTNWIGSKISISNF